MQNKIISLRMERQHLSRKATANEYDKLYCDLQPGYNIYWNGFGDPPSLFHRADFDDMEYNRRRQLQHQLLKLRLIGGNIGWIIPEDLELFAALYKKPLNKPNEKQLALLELIEREGPLNIQQMKELTGMLVKEITPALHRLQAAFLIYEDQADGDWDRGWFRFSESFPYTDLEKFTRHEALKIILQRFAYRMVWFDSAMAKSYYKLPEKEIKAASAALVEEGIFAEHCGGYLLKTDEAVLAEIDADVQEKSVFVMHKNDFLYRAHMHLLTDEYKRAEFETIYYLLIDGEFKGACYGKFRYGPPDFDDMRADLPEDEAENRRDDIIAAVHLLSQDKSPEKYNGKILL